MSDESTGVDPSPGRQLLIWAAVAVTLGAMSAIMFASHRAGHWWGDDWALYIRQARSLLARNPGEVSSDNLFTVEMSRGPAFSPPLYPWGFPMILAPFVLVVGRDVDQLAIVPVLCAVVFGLAWFQLARRRLGDVPALVGVVAVTLTPLLLGWSELIQSEWPFLAVTGLALLGIDRLAERNAFVDVRQSIWPLVGLGLGATAAFSVRREGLAVVGAIAAAQLAGLLAADRGWWSRRDDRVSMAMRLLTPHLAALASVLTLQWILPSTLVPRYSGTSVRNVWRFRRSHIDHIAEVAGFKEAWNRDGPEVLGNGAIGWTVVVTYFALASVGIVLAVVVFRRRDLHLVAYVIGALLVGGSFRSAINRYVVTLAPLLTLLAAGAVFTALSRLRWRHLPTIVTTVLLGTIALGNVVRSVDRMESAREFAAVDAVEWGSTHPAALEMFGFVIDESNPADVIAAPKARAMTMITDRRAVQVDDLRPIPESVELRYIVVEPDTELFHELAASPEQYGRVWANERFVIFEPLT